MAQIGGRGDRRFLASTLDAIGQDARFALRGLRRRPGFAALAILTLALGIGVNVALFTVVDTVLLRPLPYPDSGRLVTVWAAHRERGRYGASLQDLDDWRRRNRSFEEVGAYVSRSGTLVAGESPQRVAYALVTPALMRTLGVEPRLGRWFDEKENLPGRDDVALLGHALWKQQFGGAADVLGRSVTLDGRRLRIVGVMPPGFDFPGGGRALWKPFGMGPDDGGPREGRWVRAVARLAPGVSLASAREDVGGIMAALAREYPESNRDFVGEVEPLLETVSGEARPTLALLAAAVAAVLLVACANVATLLLGRAVTRAGGELVVRAALGASRARVAVQLLIESATVALLGGAVALALSRTLLVALPALGAEALPRAARIGFDARTFGFAAGAALLCALVSGVAPALRAGRIDAARALRGGGSRLTGGSRRGRSALAVSEIALATALLLAAGLIGRSLARVLAVDPGFVAAGALGFDFDPEWRVRMDDGAPEAELRKRWAADRDRAAVVLAELEERLATVPGVERVGLVNAGPLGGSRWATDYEIEGRPALGQADRPVAMYRVVDGDYFATLGIPLLRGRALGADDRAGSEPVAVVDAALARAQFGDDDPVGERIALDGATWYRIVGVVGAVADVGLESAPQPKIYVTFAQAQWGYFGAWHNEVFVRAPATSARAIRAVVAALAPELPPAEISPAGGLVESAVASRRFTARLLGGFAVLALLLAAIGLYGVVSHSVRARARELGIRAALGAAPSTLVASTLGDALRLTAFGLLGGVAIAAAFQAVLRSQLFGVGVADPATFALVAVTLGAIALVSALAPAAAVARTDPARTLRAE